MTTTIPPRLRWAAVASVGLLIGCGSGSFDPRIDQTRTPAELTILQLPEVPTLVNDSAGFWAVKGEDRSVELYYADSLGQPAERLLRFEVEDDALDRYPDGTRFHGHDSVFISIQVTDPATLAFDFAPSGLRFKKSHPAKLTISYGRAANQPPLASHSHHDDDDDDDGDDAGDDNPFGIWMQEQTNGSFSKLKSRVYAALEEVEADVPGFSRYALAY